VQKEKDKTGGIAMLILVDHADINEIKALYEEFPYDGVTTNPSILKKVGGNPMKVLKEIRAFLPKEAQLHAQLVSQDKESMLREAQYIWNELGSDTYVKVPVTKEGFKAMAAMHAKGVKAITATAIYTAMQAFMAAKAGARYTAPYVNRIDNLGADGVKTAIDIHMMFCLYGLKADVLAASFKNSQQVLELCKAGIGSITAAPDILRNLIVCASTASAVDVFTKDFGTIAGEGKTMCDF
jgi:fructose-6-phosphate aldolase 1/fructose-6-phosphate aldolase 2